jgi:hypothetical protein
MTTTTTIVEPKPHRFEVVLIPGDVYGVILRGHQNIILAVGETEKDALQNFEMAAARFIRSEHMKAMPAMVGAR